MLTEIDGERLWRAFKHERIATKGEGTKISEAKMNAIKRMPISVLASHQHRVVNYRTVVDAKDALSWYMAWARPTEALAFWQRPLLLSEQIMFSVIHLYRRFSSRDLEVMDKKLERELFSRLFNAEMIARYDEGSLTIGELVLGQPSMFLGE